VVAVVAEYTRFAYQEIQVAVAVVAVVATGVAHCS
jgi:hypothetical protein